MKKDSKKIINIFLRYFFILIIGLGNLYLVYKLLTFPTIYIVNLIINIFTSTTLIENTIQFGQTAIEIAPSCVAGSAFYLLLALLLSTSTIKPRTRFYAILTALTTLFILNIARILILASIITTPNFETIHWIFWHLASTFFVVAIYIATIKLYKIKSIPIYSDFKYIKKLGKQKRKRHKKK